MLADDFVTMEIGKTKHIALVAHDGKKKELVEWCDKNKDILKKLLEEILQVEIERIEYLNLERW